MDIAQARQIIASIPRDRRAALQAAHWRYMHFTGVSEGDIPAEQVAQDRVTFAHLLKYTEDGRPALSDKRCAEFMATITEMPHDWCMAFDEVDFCDTHGDNFAELQLRRQASDAIEAGL